MYTENYFDFFKAPSIDKPSHMITDVQFWSHQFGLLYDGGSQAMRKAIKAQIKYMDTLKKAGLDGKDEEKFVRHMSALIRLLQDQLENKTVTTDIYERIGQKLECFTDDPENCTQTVGELYRKARKDLDKQTKLVQKQGKKYHKLFVRMERAEIKARLAYRQRALDNANRKLEDLTDKVEAKYAKYYKELGKWRYVFTHVQNLASEYKTAYVSRETSRATVVLSCLQDLAEHIMAANSSERGPMFIAIVEPRFARERLVDTETIQIPDNTVLKTHKAYKDRLIDLTTVKPSHTDGLEKPRSETPLHCAYSSSVDATELHSN